MFSNRTTLSAIFPIFTFTLAVSTDFQSACLDFNPVSLITNSTLRILEHVPANTTLTFPGNDESCARPKQLITNESCRIALTIPTFNSSIIFEIFLPTPAQGFQRGVVLPAPADWTGRFLGTGNGGIDGCIKYEDIAYGLSHGFATTGSNNGHNGTGGKAFLNNLNIVTDFSWRSLHTTAVAGKILTQAFYKKPHDKAYYIGCSGGGRQAIQAASLFPEDYNGIVAGAPGINFNYMSAWRASFYTIAGSKNSTDFIKPETWTRLIHTEILRQCDEIDGVKDGILADASLCAAVFRPEALLCNTNQSSNCLSAKQVDIVRKVYSPLYGEKGELIYPSLQPGAEVQAIQRLLAGSPFSYSEDWFRYAVYRNPEWDPASWTIHDAEVAEELNPANVRSWPDSLTNFKDNGGKLLLYHGGADNQITGFNTERFYNHLSRSMAVTSTEMDTFLRFFRIPGMFHCSGGPGAWMIGQSTSGAVGYDSKRNVLAAIVEWVEKGRKPEVVVGTKYPTRSTYVGGNSSFVDSWVCR
ncbi:ferulic acid esterase [Lindgomyces ingoldianus]|uniref:Ferulic acid esterase n=1 Tax=Lindgomyces ingoldianus TaxID=673940 RepID=A0ACB6R8N4_9PLEO|nr:ferulic acid esterase [Lindgomyces ingoldianus]KAF2475133.1 ferulic acid esterase [Lindgomyces ingoldianus]